MGKGVKVGRRTFARELRKLASAIERGRSYRFRNIVVPPNARVAVEIDRDELEFEVCWRQTRTQGKRRR